MRRRALLTLIPLGALAAREARAQGVLERLGIAPISADSFVRSAAIGNDFAIDASRLLLARSQHPTIRAFAEHMIEHHSMMSSELRALPDAGTRLPPTPDERHAALLRTLRNQEEVEFLNRHFVDQQVEAHREMLAAFIAYADNGEVPALRAFARRHAPTIHQHLEMARALQTG
jgi:putative membrane protein